MDARDAIIDASAAFRLGKRRLVFVSSSNIDAPYIGGTVVALRRVIPFPALFGTRNCGARVCGNPP